MKGPPEIKGYGDSLTGPGKKHKATEVIKGKNNPYHLLRIARVTVIIIGVGTEKPGSYAKR